MEEKITYLKENYTEEFIDKILSSNVWNLKKERKNAINNLRNNYEMLDLPLGNTEKNIYHKMIDRNKKLIEIIDFLIAEKNG